MADSLVDAYSPAEIARKIEQLGVTKANLPLHRMATLAVMAGVFVSLGGIFYTIATAGWSGDFGTGQVYGGLVFNLGLALCALAGAELFTGNTLMVIALVNRKITVRQLLRNWGVVYFGNMVGSLLVVFLALQAEHWAGGGYLVGAKVLYLGAVKTAIPLKVAFIRAILCNLLVCLAVWAYSSGRTAADKLLAMILPITAFVAAGFEHSVANMFTIPYALALKSNPAVVAASGLPPEKLAKLTLGGFLGNLAPVTLGNIIGGSVLVGLVYWFAYLRGEEQKPVVRGGSEKAA